MTLSAASVAHLYRMMPGTKTVTYYVLGASQTFDAGVTVYRAEKRPTSQTDHNGNTIQFASDLCTWHLWVAQLGSIVPKISDKIVDADSVRWNVDACELELLDKRWRLVCSKGVVET